jgi:hypothetical protein
MGMCHTQLRAPTSVSFWTKWPLRWRATRDSKPPTQVPPMKTEGAGLRGVDDSEGKAAISWSSNSMTVGWTPMVASSFFITWHMQHEDRLKMITGCSDISLLMRASADSATSMDREEDDDDDAAFTDDGVAEGVRSSLIISFEQRLSPCIAEMCIC